MKKLVLSSVVVVSAVVVVANAASADRSLMPSADNCYAHGVEGTAAQMKGMSKAGQVFGAVASSDDLLPVDYVSQIGNPFEYEGEIAGMIASTLVDADCNYTPPS